MKKKLSILSLTLLLLGAAIGASAQGVSVEAKIDSMEIFIGEQTGVTLTVLAPGGKAVEMPPFKARQEIAPGVEIVDIMKDDTAMVDDATRRIRRKYILTSFDEGAYLIPEFKVKVSGKEYTTNQLALKVLGVEVDTLHLDQFYGPQDVQDNPFLWSEWSPLFWMSFIMLLLVAIAFYLFICLKQNKPIISRILVIRHIPAHQKALNAIDKIKQEKMQTSEDQKLYYTRLTDALRKYIEERFGFSAMEMTTSEIIARLRENTDQTSIRELRELFETADLVKFAKYSTLINENDLNLVNAINFIDQTKTQEKETEEKIVPQLSKDDKRVKESRMIIKTLLWAIGASVAFIFCYVAYNVLMLI